MKKVMIISILLIFLVGLASAGNGNGYGYQYKNGIGFENNVNVDDFTVLKNQNRINIQSQNHYETSVKIPYSDIEGLEGFKGTININHYTDSGFNDWTKTVSPENENGYVYLDLEFSEVSITVGESHLENWYFQDWSSGTTNVPPDNWEQGHIGYSRSGWSKIGDYSINFNGGGRGEIDQDITITVPGNYTLGAWFRVDDATSGYFLFDIKNVGDDQIKISSNTNEEWEYHEITNYITAEDIFAGPQVRLQDISLNSGANVRVDGVLIYRNPEILTATESHDDTNIYLNFTGTIDESNIVNTIVTEFTNYDMTQHGKLGTPIYEIDTVSKTGYLADSRVYIDASGVANGTYNFNITIPYNLPPTLISPTNGSTIEREFPPLYDDITFTWEDVGTTCQIQISEDTSFSNVVYSGETALATKTVSLAEGTYYWRVRSYDPEFEEHGAYPDTYNFIIVSTSSTIGNGVHGVVFEAESLGSSIPLPSALVTIYNDTYSDTAVTGPEGYYQFPVSNGTYIVYASLSGYDTSALLPVNVTGNYTIMNIPLIQSESYFSPHYVRFVVTDSWYWERYEGATVTVYENEDTSVLYTETTGSDGAVGFELSENVEYRIVTTYGDITQTDYISPTESTYYIVLEDIETTLLPDNQFYDIVSINITKTEINSTNAQINIVYNDSAENTNSIYFELGQSYDNGTLNILDTSAVYSEDCNIAFNVTGYLGQSYIIRAVIDHGDFGEIVKYYSVDFPSNALPFTGKGIVYLCIIILFVVAAQFGKADSTQGAILLCGLTWFFWGMDIFVTFGETINSLIGVGLGIATTYALLAYINKKRTEEGI